jgi:hypothetical protein
VALGAFQPIDANFPMQFHHGTWSFSFGGIAFGILTHSKATGSMTSADARRGSSVTLIRISAVLSGTMIILQFGGMSPSYDFVPSEWIT